MVDLGCPRRCFAGLYLDMLCPPAAFHASPDLGVFNVGDITWRSLVLFLRSNGRELMAVTIAGVLSILIVALPGTAMR